jgi:hypothetical protein
METPSHPNVGRIYSVVTITTDTSRKYEEHDWTVKLPEDQTETDEPNLKGDSIITPWGTFNVPPEDVGGRHTRLDDSGMNRVALAFQRMRLDEVDTS